jgi:mRNA interferase MazF
MKRGDIVLIREPGTPASKARPCVIVQRTSTLDDPPKITACPLTSELRGAAGQRPFVAPGPGTGLRRPSEVEIDWIYTHRVDHVGAVIGSVDSATLDLIDIALRRWLDL